MGKKRPEIRNIDLFFDEKQELLLPNDIELLELLVSKILKKNYNDKEILYDPIIVLSNCKADLSSTIKKNKYKNIVFDKDDINSFFIDNFLNLYSQTIKSYFKEFQFFPLDKVKSISKIEFNITITSIAEDIITFKSNREIPYFTVFMIEKPITFMVTNIPAFKELDKNKDGYHYMGIISGTTEKDQEFLRKFVNFLIKNKPDEFEYDPYPKKEKLSEIVGGEQSELKKDKEIQNKIEENNKNEKKKESDRFVVMRPTLPNIKSKL